MLSVPVFSKLPGLLLFFLLITIGIKAQQDSVYLGTITLSGNKKTKAGIIFREITVQSGTYYKRDFLEAQLQRSRQNLMNLALFNFVDLTQTVHGDTINVDFRFTERWYIWPSPLFEFVDPNFNVWFRTKDLSRTSYGFLVTQYNFRGRNETLRIRAKFGYNEQYSLSYEAPYINKARKLGMGLYLSYYQNYQINTATENNERVFFTVKGDVAREELSLGSRFTYRRAQYARHYFNFKVNQVGITDSVARLYPDYLQHGLTNRRFLELGYQYTFDKRDYGPYPLVGSLYSASIYKPDLSIGKGQQDQVVQLYGQVKKYHALGQKVFFAYSVSGKYSFYKTMPYYFQKGLGYGDFVRGYEYYIIDAQHYGLVKTSLKYCLLKKREFKIPLIPWEKFNRIFLTSYLNFNVDVGYAYDKLYQTQNPLANTLLLGGGVGIDFISFYDVIIRLEGSVNKLGEPGFFIHFNRPI